MEETATLETAKRAAHDFAASVAETPQFKAFEQAAERFRRDLTAQEAMQAYQQKEQSLRVLLMLKEASAEQRADLDVLYQAFVTLPSVMEYSKAQSELAALCQTLGDMVSEFIGLDYAASCGASCCG
jgi:cell fate (sporulation/competence/biofilm development) regulator YlbF (YheA/YmcA/DUF963 family)